MRRFLFRLCMCLCVRDGALCAHDSALRARDGAAAPDDGLIEPELLQTFPAGVPAWIPVAGGALILLFVLIRRRIRRHDGRAPSPEEGEPLAAPGADALAALDALGRSLPGSAGEEDAFHVKLSRIVRVYLSDRFLMDALEMASHEMVETLAREEGLDGGGELLPRLLDLCDRVKFGRRSVGKEAAREAIGLAREFILATAKAGAGRQGGVS